MKKYFEYYLVLFVDEKTTKALFQATIILAGCFLIGVKDQSAFLYKEEAIAYELKNKFEVENAIKELNGFNCKALNSNLSECKLVQYKLNHIKSYTEAFISVLDLIHDLLMYCCVGFLSSFFLRAFVTFEIKDS